jgi:hypothetical protein
LTKYTLGLTRNLRDFLESGQIELGHDGALVDFAKDHPRGIFQPVTINTAVPLGERHFRLLLDAFLALCEKVDGVSIDEALQIKPSVTYARRELREATGQNAIDNTWKPLKSDDGTPLLDERGMPRQTILCGALQTVSDLRGVVMARAFTLTTKGMTHAKVYNLPGIESYDIFGETFTDRIDEEAMIRVGTMRLVNKYVVLNFKKEIMAYAKAYALLIRMKAKKAGIAHSEGNLLYAIRQYLRGASPLVARGALWNLYAPGEHQRQDSHQIHLKLEAGHYHLRDIFGISQETSIPVIRKTVRTALRRAYPETPDTPFPQDFAILSAALEEIRKHA